MALAARVLHVLLAAIWLGSSVFFIVFAPAVGDVVDSRHLAGDVITAALNQIDLYGVLAAPVLLVTLFVGWLPLTVPLRNRAVAVLVMGGAVVISRYWVTPQLMALKASMAMRIEHMDPAIAVVKEYQSFHSISASLMVVHLAACLMLLVTAMTSRPRRSFGIEL